jgi:hypothetical protein
VIMRALGIGKTSWQARQLSEYRQPKPHGRHGALGMQPQALEPLARSTPQRVDLAMLFSTHKTYVRVCGARARAGTQVRRPRAKDTANTKSSGIGNGCHAY